MTEIEDTLSLCSVEYHSQDNSERASGIRLRTYVTTFSPSTLAHTVNMWSKVEEAHCFACGIIVAKENFSAREVANDRSDTGHFGLRQMQA